MLIVSKNRWITKQTWLFFRSFLLKKKIFNSDRIHMQVKFYISGNLFIQIWSCIAILPRSLYSSKNACLALSSNNVTQVEETMPRDLQFRTLLTMAKNKGKNARFPEENQVRRSCFSPYAVLVFVHEMVFW